MSQHDRAGQLELPSLEAGVTLLSTDDRATGALQSLVLDHLLTAGGEAYWVDSRNNATTTTLSRLAPDVRVLDRLQVARAFTPFQHYGLVEDLPAAMASDASIVVLPAVDWFYDEDELRRGEGKAMLQDVLETVSGIAVDDDLPVVVTRHGTGGTDDVLDDAVDAEVECVHTPFGPRFSGTDFETFVFECGTGVQTTLAFWRRVLQQRHPTTVREPTTGVTAVGSH